MHNGIAEQWKSIQGYEGVYEVSDRGRVRSLARTVTFKDGRSRMWPSQTLAQTSDNSGHLRVSLNKAGIGAMTLVHQVVAAAFIGPAVDGMEIRHLNDQKGDNRLANLAYGTRSENILDRVRNGIHHHSIKTHCRRGHRLAEPNLVESSLRRGKRDCKACRYAHNDLHRKGQPTESQLKTLADIKYLNCGLGSPVTA